MGTPPDELNLAPLARSELDNGMKLSPLAGNERLLRSVRYASPAKGPARAS